MSVGAPRNIPSVLASAFFPIQLRLPAWRRLNSTRLFETPPPDEIDRALSSLIE